MRNKGWDYYDLAGELWARGIDVADVPSEEISSVLCAPHPEIAADCLERGVPYRPEDYHKPEKERA